MTVKKKAIRAIVSANASRRSRGEESVTEVLTVNAAKEYVEALDRKGLLRPDISPSTVEVLGNVTVVDTIIPRASVTAWRGMVTLVDEAAADTEAAEMTMSVEEADNLIAALIRAKEDALFYKSINQVGARNIGTVTKQEGV